MVKSINRDKFLTVFCRKGFNTQEGKGETTVYFEHNGKATEFRTHCSRGAKGKTLQPFHIKAMANQLNLTEEQFLGIFNCSLGKEDFIKIQAEHKGGNDPLDLL